jgi:hypothetical protein
VRVAGIQTSVEALYLSFGEVFGAVPQQPADAIQRIVFVAAMPELLCGSASKQSCKRNHLRRKLTG